MPIAGDNSIPKNLYNSFTMSGSRAICSPISINCGRFGYAGQSLRGLGSTPDTAIKEFLKSEDYNFFTV